VSEQVSVHEHAAVVRCAYCHDDLGGEEWRCGSCGTGYHAACAAELLYVAAIMVVLLAIRFFPLLGFAIVALALVVDALRRKKKR
jgi:hypothetical protein